MSKQMVSSSNQWLKMFEVFFFYWCKNDKIRFLVFKFLFLFDWSVEEKKMSKVIKSKILRIL